MTDAGERHSQSSYVVNQYERTDAKPLRQQHVGKECSQRPSGIADSVRFCGDACKLPTLDNALVICSC